MPAIEIITVMKDQNPAGVNAALLGRMSTGSSKNSSPNDFLGMMQMTMADYQTQTRSQNQNRTEENPAPGSDENEMGKIFLTKSNNPAQDNGKSKKAEGNASPGEVTTKPANEKSTDEQKETIATPAFIAAFIEKIITRAKTAGTDETGAASVLAIQKEGKRGPITLKDVLAMLNETFDSLGKEHKVIIASLAKKNQPLTEANLTINQPEMKNQLVMALQDMGLSVEEINGILKAIEETSVKFSPNNQMIQTKNQPEMKNQLVMALEDKGLSAEEIKGILKAVEETLVKFSPNDQMIQTINQPEMKNQLVMALEDKGLSVEEINGILKAIEETLVKLKPADQSLQTINHPEMKNELVKALEVKVIPADVISGIIKEIDQVIMAKVPEVTQDTTGKSPFHVEPTLPSFRQAAVAILEKKGFSVEDIKVILKAVDQATVGGLKPDLNPRSDQSIFIQQSLYHKEFIEAATVGRKKIHADIYQKEASLEDFRHENVEGRIKINPSEKQLVNEGPQKELLEQPENNKRSEKKDVFAAALKGAENKQPIVGDKDITAQQFGKVITATAQDDQGKWAKLAGDVTAKTSNSRHEDIILPVGREQSPLQLDTLSMAAKGAEFHTGKTTMDNSKSIYQSVVDQIQDSFALAQNKDNGQVRLTLKPEMMGHLDMQIAVRNETVQIMMTVENEKVHQAMNAHIDDLKTALQNQGLKIDKIEVTLQNQPDPERNFYQDQANPRFNNPGQNSHQERMTNREQYLGEDNYPKNIQEIIQKQNSMEGVSIFA